MADFNLSTNGYDRRVEARLEEEKGKPGVAKTILRIGAMGGRIGLNSKTRALYVPINPNKMGSIVIPNLSKIREKTKLKVRRW